LRGLPWDSNTFGGILRARNWGRMVSICCITGVLGVLPDLGCHGGSRSSDGMGMITWIRRWAGCLYSISNSFLFSALESSNRDSSLALSRTLLCRGARIVSGFTTINAKQDNVKYAQCLPFYAAPNSAQMLKCE